MSSIYSKVILSGEHSVLRGGLAVVAPFKKYELEYFVEPASEFSLNLEDKIKPYEILIQGTLEKALSLVEKNYSDLNRSVRIKSLVPLGKGLGGSAALCVFISNLMREMDWIEEKEKFSFSKELENIFHGESSGVDIAGCVSSQIQSYIRGEVPKKIEHSFKPKLFLSPTGEIGSTEDCIEKVLELKKTDLPKFNDLDDQMNTSSEMVLKGLIEDNFEIFDKGLSNASEVFKNWDLFTPKMMDLQAKLMALGASAVKPTGSGLGGHMLSSWSNVTTVSLDDLPEGSLELNL